MVLSLHGCAGIYSVVEFEVLEPANVSLPEDVGQLMILNRSPFTLNTIHEDNRGDMDLEKMVIVDTTIINNIFRGLLEVLRQSPIRRFHFQVYLSQRRGDTTSLQDLILTKREVTTLCEKYISDAIISLELYTIHLDVEKEYYPDAEDILLSRYYPVSSKLQWNIYLPGHPKPFDSYTMMDTIFFSEIVDGVVQPLPSAMEMITELCYGSGMRYGAYLVPVWTQSSRVLYKGKGDSLKQASKLTAQGDWDHAYKIWKGLTTSDDSTMVSKAFHNMALYYELEDNLDSASLLINMAVEHDTLEMVRLYKEELDTRILNRNELFNQVR